MNIQKLIITFFGVFTIAQAYAQCRVLYVAPAANANGVGTKSAPYTVKNAFKKVQDGDIIRMAEGQYILDSALVLMDKNNIVLEGGFNQNLDWKKSNVPQSTRLIRSGQNPEGNPLRTRLVGLHLSNCKDLLLQDFSISTVDAQLKGQSCYGVHISNSDYYKFVRVDIKAGNAGHGQNGFSGLNGLLGSDGKHGKPGDKDNSSIYLKGGDGGNGGSATGIILGGIGGGGVNSSRGGSAGKPGLARNGGGGGGGGAGGVAAQNGGLAGYGGSALALPYNSASNIAGGVSGNPGKAGVNGKTGLGGVNGSVGTSASNYQFAQFFEIGSLAGNGTDGGGGQGGTGGTGGGGQTCTFGCIEGTGNCAGGGGGGGEGGEGGRGGSSGGGSFGVYIVNNGTQTDFINSNIAAGLSGKAGMGGEPGMGGEGGKAGLGDSLHTDEIGAGGDGGKGGKGGNGGQGGNGVEGYAAPVKIVSGTAPNTMDITEVWAAYPIILTSELTALKQTVALEAIAPAVQWTFENDADLLSSTSNPVNISFKANSKHSLTITTDSKTYKYPYFLCHCEDQTVTFVDDEVLGNHIWDLEGAVSLTILDLNGKVIWTQSLPDASSWYKHTLMPGVYIVQVHTQSEKSYASKFIKY